MKKVLLATIAFSLVFTACRKDRNNDISYQVNENTSVALWKGSTSETSNDGSFQVTSTKLTINNNSVVSGNFIIPIASIKNFNLPDELKPVLINHLKSADFFNIALHPEAKFTIKTIRPYIGNGDGAITGANQFVTGDFSMIGKTLSISFPAKRGAPYLVSTVADRPA
ncbi:MAG: YceI family protein, partial [Chitinophagaceae bacterium]